MAVAAIGNSGAMGGRTAERSRWVMGWRQRNGRHNGQPSHTDFKFVDLWQLKSDLLHPFVRIRVIYNRNLIIHNQWEWVVYNQRKRVPISPPPFFGCQPFFVTNIPILLPII
jgi:hypothetical protein